MPLSPIRRHVFPASRWRRFGRMPEWPDNLVVVGDAVCGFNPVHGQGMTVGAMNAVVLARALERPKGAQVPGFARRLQRELAPGDGAGSAPARPCTDSLGRRRRAPRAWRRTFAAEPVCPQ